MRGLKEKVCHYHHFFKLPSVENKNIIVSSSVTENISKCKTSDQFSQPAWLLVSINYRDLYKALLFAEFQ